MQFDLRDPEPRTNPIAKDKSLDAALTAIQHKHWVRRRLAQVRMAPSASEVGWPISSLTVALAAGFTYSDIVKHGLPAIVLSLQTPACN